MELSRLYELRYFASMLMNGIDPTSRNKYEEDTVMNIPEIKKYNSDICELLDEYIAVRSSLEHDKKGKIPFFLVQSEVDSFIYSKDPLSISALCYKLNRMALPGMRKLSAVDLTKGLVQMGILYQEYGEPSDKRPTNDGLALGITREQRQNSYGNIYYVNLYNDSAQKFVVDNLQKILNSAH